MDLRRQYEEQKRKMEQLEQQLKAEESRPSSLCTVAEISPTNMELVKMCQDILEWEDITRVTRTRPFNTEFIEKMIRMIHNEVYLSEKQRFAVVRIYKSFDIEEQLSKLKKPLKTISDIDRLTATRYGKSFYPER